MYTDGIIDHNIKLSTLIFILKNGLQKIEHAQTLELAKRDARDALELYEQMKDK